MFIDPFKTYENSGNFYQENVYKFMPNFANNFKGTGIPSGVSSDPCEDSCSR